MNRLKLLLLSRKARVILFVMFGLLTLVGIKYVQAQQFYIERSSYDLRIVNQTGSTIYLKIVGAAEGRFFHVRLRPNRYVDQDFYPGQRVVCIWNANGEIIRFGALDINKDGTLRLSGHFVQRGDGIQRPRTVEPASPDFQIE